MEAILEKILKFLHLEKLIENVVGYVTSQVELFKLEIREETAKVVAHGLMIALIILFFTLFVLFISFGLAGYINQEMASAHAGYWIVSGVYALPLLILVLFRRGVIHFFERYILNQINKKDH